MEFKIKRAQKCILRADKGESEAVKTAVCNLASDLEKTLGVSVQIVWSGSKGQTAEDFLDGDRKKEENCQDSFDEAVPGITIGTLGVSGEIGKLEGPKEHFPCDETGKFRREAYLQQVCDGKLVIAGSDRRGTIYGIYELSEMLGVSPWYFWADVPVRKRQEFTLPEGYQKADYPSVEYRGIFINDEEELEAWVKNYMGEPTIGVKTYEKVFELLLRLKGNYIWPAMHVNSFNLTPENGALADRMGIVVGTSHCDMLMRSNNREWKPWVQKKGYTDAVYDYSIEGRNRDILKEYWRESVEQNREYEVCYTLGMRGIHDSGFETRDLEGKPAEEIRRAKVALLEKIIGDQREILRETLQGKSGDGNRSGIEDTPGTMMTFIPYKEVLELYDNGLQVPEDMTLVWANDNYGYIRRYPSEKEKTRKGGNGIYYHNSYWAPPSMSYVFLCSIPLAHTRNELQKAWNEGIRKLWVLNSGAMKPLEQEITFFLRLAWEIGKPGALTEDVEAFVEDWINRTFSSQERIAGGDNMDGGEPEDSRDIAAGGEAGRAGIGKEVSRLLNDFSQLTNVRKLENMDYDAFSQTAYGDEAVVRIHAYEELFQRGNALYESLPEEERDAFFQLVLMRIHAGYFTNLAYYYGDRSTLMHDQGYMQAAACYTAKSREAEDARRRLLYYYNHVMCRGKWNGILDPEGFPPPRAAMMPVCTPPLSIQGEPSMGVEVWNGAEELTFVTPGEKWIQIGNHGTGSFEVRLQAPEWVRLSDEQAIVSGERRILVSVSDLSADRQGEIRIENRSDGSTRNIPVSVVKASDITDAADTAGAGECCALEEDGLVVLEAEKAWNIARMQVDTGAQEGDFRWIPRLGRMWGALVEACALREPGNPLQYCFLLRSRGEFLLEIHRFPSLDSVGRLRVGVAVDNGPVQIVESFSNDEWRGSWKENVLNNVDRLYLQLPFLEAGCHRLFLWAVDRYFAFSRLLIYTSPRKGNNLAGIRGPQSLPLEWNMTEWCNEFYGTYDLPPRPVFYARYEDGGDSLEATCQAVQAECYGRKVEPGWYLERGKHIFREEQGGIRIDAAAALAGSRWAWTEGARSMDPGKGCDCVKSPEERESPGQRGTVWRHCASESFGRSGLALYIRTPGRSWKAGEAPGLHYRIRCQGGKYTVWMLSKFNVREESMFGIGFDGGQIPEESLYRSGSLWRYEAEQIYRWVPVTDVELEAGEHVFSVYAFASGMRYDRFYLTRGGEQPPVDVDWIK